VHEVTESGIQLKFLVVIDEFTRRCLEIRVARSCKARDVVQTLGELFREHGTPAFIRSDNGPEFVAKEVTDFLKDLPVQTAFIEPGSPWQNGYCESFNSQLSSEFTDGTIFRSKLEAEVLAEDYKHFYNTERLHGALNYTTPEEAHRAWVHGQRKVESLIQTGS
jgi:transposase InsO family protein